MTDQFNNHSAAERSVEERSHPVLERFRTWLDEALAQADALGEAEPRAELATEARAVGLFQVIEEFSALRHELKLQTKAGRALQEQAEKVLGGLDRAIEEFHAVESKEAEAARAAAQPLAEALVALHESLERGRAVIEAARRRILEESVPQVAAWIDEAWRREPWWRRRVSRRLVETLRSNLERQAGDVYRGVLDSLMEGYGLIQKRLQRAMKEEQIQQMECVGRPADPHAMTVVEVVEDPSRPAGLVIDELRPGYYWKGRVLRFAEVRSVSSAGRL